MQRLLNIQCDILALTAAANEGPTLPPPDSLAGAVAGLLQAGLLAQTEGRITLTVEGRIALDQVRDRITLVERQ